MSRYPWQGIPIRIHPLFWLIIFLSVWSGYFIEVITLFVLVVIHEMGHITAAKGYGWRVHSMELLPFGGVAKMEEWGTVSAKEEVVVALAGPFHHVFIICMSFLLYWSGLWSKGWTEYFIWANVLIASFNLLPIYPLDGGRVLQSLLSYCVPYRLCMIYTLWGSLLFSGLLFVISFSIPGYVVHLPLCLISLFLLFSNAMAIRELGYQYILFLLHRRDKGVSDPMKIQRIRVKEGDSLQKVMRGWYKERYHVLEVVDRHGQLLELLPEEVVLEKYFTHTPSRWCG